jgi:hypothetical protein
MLTGAATNDRLGRTTGMTTEKVWAWRMAMRIINHSGALPMPTRRCHLSKWPGGWRMGRDSGNNLAFSRLGVRGPDLETKDPGEVGQQE